MEGARRLAEDCVGSSAARLQAGAPFAVGNVENAGFAPTVTNGLRAAKIPTPAPRSKPARAA